MKLERMKFLGEILLARVKAWREAVGNSTL